MPDAAGLSLPEILEHIEYHRDTFPHDAFAAAVARQDEITPALLDILQLTLDNIEERADDPGYVGHFSAMTLLAKFREIRALPLVAQIAALPEHFIDPLLGDFITDGLARVLASVSGGDMTPLQRLAEDGNANEWARAEGTTALTCLVAAGLRSREEILAYFQTLYEGGLEREPSAVWTVLVTNTLSLYPDTLAGHIETALHEDLLDEFTTDEEDIRDTLAQGLEAAMSRLHTVRDYQLIDSVEDALRWIFQPWPEEEEKDLAPPDLGPAPYFIPTPGADFMSPTPHRREVPKVGRNDPCPCGSGKKYKKCCGR